MKSESNQSERATWWDESPSAGAPAHGHQAPHYVAQPAETRNPEPHGNTRESRDSNSGFDWDKVAFLVLAVLLPPLGVFFQTGCNKDLAINGLLTLLGYIPGIIHAVYVILRD